MLNKKIKILAENVGVCLLDVGARGGISQDLLALAPVVKVFGFEPDPDECGRLNTLDFAPWKRVTYIPHALGSTEGDFNLNLYRQRGCSSKFTARQEYGERFSRGDYYINDGVVTVPVKPLDVIISEYHIPDPAFMKIDVQGMEVEVFQGGGNTLANSLVAIRTEVSFFPMYDGQPLFAEVDQFLRRYNFYPMGFPELHAWRRITRNKLPRLGPRNMPYSKGQLIHGDVLYMLLPDDMPDSTEEQIKRLLRLALVSICTGYLDHAAVVFKRKAVHDYCSAMFGVDFIGEIERLSRAMAKGLRIPIVEKLKWLFFPR